MSRDSGGGEKSGEMEPLQEPCLETPVREITCNWFTVDLWSGHTRRLTRFRADA